MKLTELEQDFLQAICEYDSMYLDRIALHLEVAKKTQLSGLVSALVRKGLVTTIRDNADPKSPAYGRSIISLTREGKQAQIELM